MSSPGDRYQRLVRRTAEVKARVDELRGQLKNARHDAVSDDEQITATVDANGRLIGLQIDPRVFRRPDSEGLAAAIVNATRQAADAADVAMAELVENGLGVSIDAEQLRTGELEDATIEGIGGVLREDG